MAILPTEGDSMFSATLLVAASIVAQSDIETKYDKFDDATTYTVLLEKTRDDDDSHFMVLACRHKGEGRKPMPGSKDISLQIAHFGPRWLYSEKHDVKMMEGRNRFVLLETDYEKSVDDKDGRAKEFIHIDMTIAEGRKRLESGKDWEIKIGDREPISLGDKTRKKIKAFLDHVQMK
jgi:hypothetical protein